MQVHSINPNNGEYFLDRCSNVSLDDLMYNGHYQKTPIYPRYTFNAYRKSYTSEAMIEFFTMLPIKRMFNNHLVEFNLRYNIETRNEDYMDIILNEFKLRCEENIKTIDVTNLY